MQSLLTFSPSLCVPFLTASLTGHELPLGLKLLVLEWLMSAAREMSNVPSDETETETVVTQTAGIGAGTSIDGRASTSNSRSSGGSRVNTKVTIKRPAMLANSKKKRTVYFRNNFRPVAHLFFYPLMSLLGRIWNNKLNESAQPVNSASKFNIISEMFESKSSSGAVAAAAAAGAARARTSTNASTAAPAEMAAATVHRKDCALEHLDGVDALLPSQCLVALGLFTQCAVNTTSQRYEFDALMEVHVQLFILF